MPPPLFAAIGHQETWEQMSAVVDALRDPGQPGVNLSDLRSIVPWIPPRTVSRFQLRPDRPTGPVESVYIDSFIGPEQLAMAGTSMGLLRRVEDAISAAVREGAQIATLGGFTSILYESARPRSDRAIAVTTGNSLTAALIVRGVERATALLKRNLAASNLLVIGATGDVGSAVARALAGRVAHLTLVARNPARLEREAAALASRGRAFWTVELGPALAEADLIVAASSASEPLFALDDCRPNAIICDAGYPKNVEPGRERRSFWGGMGQIAGGFPSHDGLLERFYTFPVGEVAHGCILEGAVLALASRFESFSSGRGRITPERMDEIWALAEEQGVRLAPLFDSEGLWPEEGM